MDQSDVRVCTNAATFVLADGSTSEPFDRFLPLQLYTEIRWNNSISEERHLAVISYESKAIGQFAANVLLECHRSFDLYFHLMWSGFPSKRARRLLAQIGQLFGARNGEPASAVFSHFGDFDLGGFEIYQSLVEPRFVHSSIIHPLAERLAGVKELQWRFNPDEADECASWLLTH